MYAICKILGLTIEYNKEMPYHLSQTVVQIVKENRIENSV